MHNSIKAYYKVMHFLYSSHFISPFWWIRGTVDTYFTARAIRQYTLYVIHQMYNYNVYDALLQAQA